MYAHTHTYAHTRTHTQYTHTHTQYVCNVNIVPNCVNPIYTYMCYIHTTDMLFTTLAIIHSPQLSKQQLLHPTTIVYTMHSCALMGVAMHATMVRLQ